MAVSEEQYNRLAEQAYWVENKREDVQYHPEEGEIYYYNSKNKSLGQFQVIKVEDNRANGMQAMAVAPVDKSGQVDYSQVVVAYAGTNRADSLDLLTDGQQLGLGSDSLYLLTPGGVTQELNTQFETALSFAKEVEKEVRKKNPKAVITTAGHSLGESLALYTALKQGYANLGFNGPDIHQLLSDNETAYMKSHKGQFRNYRNPHDMIGNITGNETGTAIYVDKKNKSGFGSDHELSNWQFDKEGHLVDQNGNIADINHVYNAVGSMVSDYMGKGFKDMKAKLKAGGYSSHEMIFLDYLSASSVASGLGTTAQIGSESIKGQANAAEQAAEELYKSLTSERPASVNKLTDEEILAIYAEEGITYDYMVTQVKEHFEKKVTMGSRLSTDFSGLSGQIERGMQGLLAEDETLGREIAGWRNGK